MVGDGGDGAALRIDHPDGDAGAAGQERAALKLADNERVAGFVYIGTAKEKPDERERPSLADIAQAWRP